VKKVVDALVKHIGAQPTELVRLGDGRVIDERTAKKRGAPARHLLLTPAKGWKSRTSSLEPDHSVIRGIRLPVAKDTGEWTAVAARSLREGTVVVTAYSPFAADLWRPDVGKAGMPKGVPPTDSKEPDGWGVQRLLDLVGLTTTRRSVPRGYPIVREVREADGGATIWVDCWTSFQEKDWDSPVLHRKGKGEVSKGWPVAVDRLTHSITYEFRNSSGERLRGPDFELQLGSNAEESEARTRRASRAATPHCRCPAAS
jgi:hypothetical protein